MSFGKTFWAVTLITLLGAFLRLFLLNVIPNAIGGDELNYILTAKSIYLSGTDLTGTWSPISILWFHYPPGPSQAELPYLLQAFIVGPLPLSLFNARVLPAIFSISTIPLMFFIGKKLIHNTAGIFAAFLMAINPWSIYMGRTAYETAFVTFFFMAGFTVLLYFKSWKLLFSIPLFFLAFYSYIGTKLIFIPFVFILCWYSYACINHKKIKKYYIAISVSCVLLVLFFAASIFIGKENRTSEILLPNSPELGTQVDALRRTTISNPLTSLFENKPVLFGKIITEKAYKTFSLDYLFINGDGFFSIGRHGLFYIIDLPFLILGFLYLLKTSRKTLYLLLGLLLVSIIPQLAHSTTTTNFSPHLTLLFPLLIIIMSAGIFYFLKLTKRHITGFIIAFIYVLFLLNFLQIYFFQHPLQGYFDFNLRTLSEYANRAEKKNDVVIMTTKKTGTIQKYLFYTNYIHKNSLPEVKTVLNSKTAKINKLLISECPKKGEVFKENITYVIDINCTLPKDQIYVSLAQLKDGGETYGIIHDNICKDVILNPYPKDITLKDFSMNIIDTHEFCRAFVVKQ